MKKSLIGKVFKDAFGKYYTYGVIYFPQDVLKEAYDRQQQQPVLKPKKRRESEVIV